MKAQELASVVPDIFLLEKYISQVGVCTLWKQPWGTPWGCHGQNISLCPSLTASLSVLSPRSRRAPLPSRGSRASSPHLPSKVLCRSCPAPAPAPALARWLLWRGDTGDGVVAVPTGGTAATEPCPATAAFTRRGHCLALTACLGLTISLSSAQNLAAVANLFVWGEKKSFYALISLV